MGRTRTHLDLLHERLDLGLVEQRRQRARDDAHGHFGRGEEDDGQGRQPFGSSSSLSPTSTSPGHTPGRDVPLWISLMPSPNAEKREGAAGASGSDGREVDVGGWAATGELAEAAVEEDMARAACFGRAGARARVRGWWTRRALPSRMQQQVAQGKDVGSWSLASRRRSVGRSASELWRVICAAARARHQSAPRPTWPDDQSALPLSADASQQRRLSSSETRRRGE